MIFFKDTSKYKFAGEGRGGATCASQEHELSEKGSLLYFCSFALGTSLIAFLIKKVSFRGNHFFEPTILNITFHVFCSYASEHYVIYGTITAYPAGTRFKMCARARAL